MVGQYLNKRGEYETFLAEWVDFSIINKSWEGYQDLHLDEIDSAFNEKENWIEGSIFIYKIILGLINPKSYSCLLVIPLAYAETETKIHQLNCDKIKSLLGSTPPSFYLFPNGEENYEATIKSLIHLEGLNCFKGQNIYFREVEEFPGEFDRSIYVVSR